MPKPPRKEFDLRERIAKIRQAGLNPEALPPKEETDPLLPLPERIQRMLGILQSAPVKSTTMNYFVLYDIQNNKVRKLIAKYLLQKGGIRVQKSVFLLHTDNRMFDEIRQTLAEINEVYENIDSIILIPLNISDARSMKLIGKNVNIDQIIDPPNTVFL